MARPVWEGALSFGLVSVPVALYRATEEHTVTFHQIQRGTNDRVRYQRVNERTGDEVDYRDIVRGVPVAGDDSDYVVFEPKELDDIAPEKSSAIEIETFVARDEVDPVYLDRAYWVAPADAGNAHAYHLLVRALADTDTMGVAQFVMHGKQHLVGVRAGEHVLVAHLLHFADEVREPEQAIPDLPASDRPRGRELDMAVQLIESMTGPWQPDEYEDTYAEQVRQLVEDKQAGRARRRPARRRDSAQVLDLTEALRRSLRGDRKSRKQAPKSVDLGELTKTELERMAREMDISGRSTMNRDELVDALRHARDRSA